MGFARQNPVGFAMREDLRMAATGVGWSCYTTNNPATAIQLTVKTLLRHVQDLAGFAIKSVPLDGPVGAEGGCCGDEGADGAGAGAGGASGIGLLA